MQKILDKHELVTWYEGWFVPEKRHAEPAIALMAEQVAFLEKRNPHFCERHVGSPRPGKLLNQSTFLLVIGLPMGTYLNQIDSVNNTEQHFRIYLLLFISILFFSDLLLCSSKIPIHSKQESKDWTLFLCQVRSEYRQNRYGSG